MNVKNPPKKKETKENEAFEFEQQFILRLPPGPAAALRQDLRTGNQSLKDKLAVDLLSDMRHGYVHYGGQVYTAKLVELPTMIDSLKTVDNKTFYKTADISQMLVCSTGEESPPDENETPWKKDKDKKFQSSHGITPPLKNVRKRRFRRILKKKYMDQPEIEKEVRRLFRYDAEAIDVKWEVVYEEEKQSSETSLNTQVIEASGTVTKADARPLKRIPTNTSMDIDKSALFGDLSSSGSEVEEDEINVLDSGDELASMSQPPTQRSLQQARSDSMHSLDIDDDSSADLQDKYGELSRQLSEIHSQRTHQEEQIASLENDDLKEKMENELTALIQKESEKEREFEILSSMINQ